MFGISLEPELWTGPDPVLELLMVSLWLAWPRLEVIEYAGAEVIDAGVPELDCTPDVNIVDNEYSALLVHEFDGETELAETEDVMTVDETRWEDVDGCVEDRCCVDDKGCVDDVDTMVDTGCEEDRAWLEDMGDVDERGVVGNGGGVEEDGVEDEGGALADAAVALRDTLAAKGVCFAPALFTGLDPPW